MCPVKTTNLTVNVCREESQWWGRLAAQVGARSRGDLQKLLLFVGLERIAPARARELKEIRRRYCAGALAALVVAMLFLDDGALRARRAARRGRAEECAVCEGLEAEAEV